MSYTEMGFVIRRNMAAEDIPIRRIQIVFVSRYMMRMAVR